MNEVLARNGWKKEKFGGVIQGEHPATLYRIATLEKVGSSLARSSLGAICQELEERRYIESVTTRGLTSKGLDFRGGAIWRATLIVRLKQRQTSFLHLVQ